VVKSPRVRSLQAPSVWLRLRRLTAPSTRFALSEGRALIAKVGIRPGSPAEVVFFGVRATGCAPVPRVGLIPAAIFRTVNMLWAACTTGTGTTQQSGDTNIFVDSRPVNPLAAADQTELSSFLGGGVQEAREPRQRNTDPAPVSQRYGELILGCFDFGRERNHFNFRNSHPKPQQTPVGVESPAGRAFGARALESRVFLPTTGHRARTSRSFLHVQHGREEVRHDHQRRKRTDTDPARRSLARRK